MNLKSYADLKDLYLQVNYQHSNNLAVKGKFTGMARRYGNMYDWLMPKDKTARILDVACGAGQFLYYLKQRGYSRYLGVDSCLGMVEYVAEYVTDMVVHQDAFNYLGCPDTHDMIFANDFIEHMDIDSGIKLVGLIHNSLNAGGQIILKTGNMAAFGGIAILHNDLTHHVGYTEKSLSTLLRLYDFKEIRVWSYTENRKHALFLKLHGFMYKEFFAGNYPKHLGKILMITGVK